MSADLIKNTVKFTVELDLMEGADEQQIKEKLRQALVDLYHANRTNIWSWDMTAVANAV